MPAKIQKRGGESRMNRKYARRLADYLEAVPDDKFDMRFTYRSPGGSRYRWFFRSYVDEDRNFCGTTACMAGYACVMDAASGEFVDDLTEPMFYARDKLGLSDAQAELLFMAKHRTRSEAIDVLRKLARGADVTKAVEEFSESDAS